MTLNNKPKAVVLDGYTLNPGDNPWSSINDLVNLTVYERTALEDIVPRAVNAEIILTNKTPLSAEILERLPNLRFIAVLATGYNVIDMDAARKGGVTVSNVPTYGTDMVAQHTLALLLELCHRCGVHSDAVHQGEWQKSKDFCFWKHPLIELRGKTLGIAGYGRIGRAVSALATAFGMEVAYFSRHANKSTHEVRFVDLPTLFATADVLSLHCALTVDSENMINATSLRQMKPSAYLINTSRGGLINEVDLAVALENGILAGAAVDVLNREPPESSPLIGCRNCIITPHIAWTGIKSRQRLMQVTAENIANYLSGSPKNVIGGIQS